MIFFVVSQAICCSCWKFHPFLLMTKLLRVVRLEFVDFCWPNCSENPKTEAMKDDTKQNLGRIMTCQLVNLPSEKGLPACLCGGKLGGGMSVGWLAIIG